MREDRVIFAVMILLSGLFLLLVPEFVYAAPAVDPFQSMLTTTTAWVSGSLGKVLSVFALIVAGFHGTHGCLKCSLGAVGLAAILAFGPGVIASLFAAV